MFFGQKLKEMRLKYAEMGVHRFAEAMGTTLKKSNLFEIEHGYAPPPDCEIYMDQIKKALDISDDNEDWQELVRLRHEPFVMQEMPELRGISPFASKTDGTRLTGEEFIKLNNHIKNHIDKHNQKARKYNGQQR